MATRLQCRRLLRRVSCRRWPRFAQALKPTRHLSTLVSPTPQSMEIWPHRCASWTFTKVDACVDGTASSHQVELSVTELDVSVDCLLGGDSLHPGMGYRQLVSKERSKSRPFTCSLFGNLQGSSTFSFHKRRSQFCGVPERLVMFIVCTAATLLSCASRTVRLDQWGLLVPGIMWFSLGGLHVFLEYLEIDTTAFLSAPGRTAVEGGWPWRTTYAVSGLACRWTAHVQNYATRGCHHSSP